MVMTMSNTNEEMNCSTGHNVEWALPTELQPNPPPQPNPVKISFLAVTPLTPVGEGRSLHNWLGWQVRGVAEIRSQKVTLKSVFHGLGHLTTKGRKGQIRPAGGSRRIQAPWPSEMHVV